MKVVIACDPQCHPMNHNFCREWGQFLLGLTATLGQFLGLTGADLNGIMLNRHWERESAFFHFPSKYHFFLGLSAKMRKKKYYFTKYEQQLNLNVKGKTCSIVSWTLCHICCAYEPIVCIIANGLVRTDMYLSYFIWIKQFHHIVFLRNQLLL